VWKNSAKGKNELADVKSKAGVWKTATTKGERGKAKEKLLAGEQKSAGKHGRRRRRIGIRVGEQAAAEEEEAAQPLIVSSFVVVAALQKKKTKPKKKWQKNNANKFNKTN